MKHESCGNEMEKPIITTSCSWAFRIDMKWFNSVVVTYELNGELVNVTLNPQSEVSGAINIPTD